MVGSTSSSSDAPRRRAQPLPPMISTNLDEIPSTPPEDVASGPPCSGLSQSPSALSSSSFRSSRLASSSLAAAVAVTANVLGSAASSSPTSSSSPVSQFRVRVPPLIGSIHRSSRSRISFGSRSPSSGAGTGASASPASKKSDVSRASGGGGVRGRGVRSEPGEDEVPEPIPHPPSSPTLLRPKSALKGGDPTEKSPERKAKIVEEAPKWELTGRRPSQFSQQVSKAVHFSNMNAMVPNTSGNAHCVPAINISLVPASLSETSRSSPPIGPRQPKTPAVLPRPIEDEVGSECPSARSRSKQSRMLEVGSECPSARSRSKQSRMLEVGHRGSSCSEQLTPSIARITSKSTLNGHSPRTRTPRTGSKQARVPASSEYSNSSPPRPLESSEVGDVAGLEEEEGEDEAPGQPALERTWGSHFGRARSLWKSSADKDDRRQAAQGDGSSEEEWEEQFPAHRRRNSALSTRVSYLLEHNGFDDNSEASGHHKSMYDGLGQATFQDLRWSNAMEYLREFGVLESREKIQELLKKGAQSYGIWSLSTVALEALTSHIYDFARYDSGDTESAARVSAPLEAWVRYLKRDRFCTDSRSGSMADRSELPKVKRSPTVTSQAVKDYRKGKRSIDPGRVETTLFVIVMIISCYIAIPWKTTPLSSTFGAGLVVARITGVGTLLWTSLLFLSMSRTLLKGLYGCLPTRSRVARALDFNETIHVYCGKMIFLFGMIHTIAHLLSTYRIFAQTPFTSLNAQLQCAKRDIHLFRWLEYPVCPINRQHGYYELLVSVTGLTGFGLLGVIMLMGYTAAMKARKRHYERFQLIHNVGMVLHVVFLFLHGVEGWFNFLGVPFVVPVCLIPLGFYATDRILRLLRFYLFKGYNIISAVIRADKKGGPVDALTFLQIAKPPHLWHFSAGMYAFLNLPEYSPWEWHPFTIISGTEDDTVDFIIAGVGDWSQALAKKCLDYKNELRSDFPQIVMDGPYAAPVTTAVNCKVLVAVGAGVGVTPFLALMARVVAMMDGHEVSTLKEVHFFWITRSADEYLFGRHHFSRIISDDRLRQKFFFHLHLTQQAPSNDAPAYLFREVVRRQSIIDREAFLPLAGELGAQDLGPSGLQVPCCWLHGAEDHDVFWVNALVDGEDEEEDEQIASAFSNHWAGGAVSVAMMRNQSTELQRKKASGPLLCGRPSSRLSSHFGSSVSSMGNRSSHHSQNTEMSVADEGQPGNGPPGPPQEADPEAPPCQDTTTSYHKPRTGVKTTLPITFGRPDFLAEIQAVGKSWPDCDIDVYVCGNDMLTQSIRDICHVLTQKSAQASMGLSSIGFMGRTQRFNVRAENFS